LRKIYLSPPHLSKYEKKYVLEAIKSNWIAPVGPFLDKFEKKISKYLGIKNVLCVSSGTAAIHLALKVLGIKNNDVVLCQNFTFIGSVYPIIYCNAKPIFIGSESESWNMCPIILKNTIIKLKKKNITPKAIIVVHLYGMPAKMNQIKKISKQFNIPIIEDAAEALGSSIENKKCGSFGDIGILSFNGNKIITTSGGGAMISNNKKYIDKARHLSTQARDNFIHYEHSEIGYNYRMSNLLAAIGLGQMKILDERVKARRKNYSYYKKIFKDLKKIKFLEERTKGLLKIQPNRWITTVLIKDNDEGIKINQIVKLLNDKNIEIRPLWKPMNLQPILSKYQYYGTGLEEKIYNKGFCLPSGSNLSIMDKKKIYTNLIKILDK
jgi:dTDP-4-amino-4,6-dideoxygalactose transaminase